MKTVKMYTANGKPAGNPGGFTLIELVIVVAVIGLVIAIAAPATLRSDSARAAGLYATAHKMAENWAMLSRNCGLDESTGNPLPKSQAIDVLAQGAAAVSSSYTACYKSTLLSPLGEQIRTDASGQPAVQGYTTAFSGGGTSPFVVSYQDVPEDVATTLAVRFSAHAVTLPVSQDKQARSDASVQVIPKPDGNYQVNVLIPSGSMPIAVAIGQNPQSTGTSTTSASTGTGTTSTTTSASTGTTSATTSASTGTGTTSTTTAATTSSAPPAAATPTPAPTTASTKPAAPVCTSYSIFGHYPGDPCALINMKLR